MPEKLIESKNVLLILLKRRKSIVGRENYQVESIWHSFRNLKVAFSRFFKGLGKYPRFDTPASVAGGFLLHTPLARHNPRIMPPPDRVHKHFGFESTGCPTADFLQLFEYYSLRFPIDFTFPESCLRRWIQPYIYFVFKVQVRRVNSTSFRIKAIVPRPGPFACKGLVKISHQNMSFLYTRTLRSFSSPTGRGGLPTRKDKNDLQLSICYLTTQRNNGQSKSQC